MAEDAIDCPECSAPFDTQEELELHSRRMHANRTTSSVTVQKIARFWYRYENLNLKLAFFLVSLQLIHLYWLTTDVVVKRITGESAFILSQGGPVLLLFVVIDYIEVPALAAGMIYYSLSIYKHRKGSAAVKKNALFLTMLAVQVFHIFWITDEVVYDTFFNGSSVIAIPYFAAWVAILIDYLELPVMADLFYRTFVKHGRKQLKAQ